MSGTMSPSTNILQPWNDKQLAASAQASAALRQIGKRFTQQIFQQTFTPTYGSPTTITVPVQNVGLISRFFAVMSVTVTNPSSGSALSRTGFGPFNALSLIQYTDPNSYTRVSTTGWHLGAVTARRHRRIPGGAVTTDSPTGFGSVMQPVSCPASIAANASGTVNVLYEIPLAYGRNTLKGGVFAGAVFATQNLQLTFNPNFAQNSTDPLGCVFTGASNSNPPTYSATLTVFQEFWDQFPLGLLQALSPDLSTIYELKNTAFSSLVQGADNYIRYTNLRQFLSTVVAFDNGGSMNAGSDVSYFALMSANQTVEWKRSPALQSYLTRNLIGDDLPAGAYLFDHSDDPIVTAAEGNTVLSVNPSTVNSGAVLAVGWEDLATASVLASAPSLAGNAGH